MERMSYIYFLYFYNKQSMQNQTYPSLLIAEEFQPIEVELQNNKESKEIDFKLVVLLVLILALGVLINEYEDQIDRPTESFLQVQKIQRRSIGNDQKVIFDGELPQSSESKQNQISKAQRKQLYFPQKPLLQTESRQSLNKDLSKSSQNRSEEQKHFNKTLQSVSVINQSNLTEKSSQNHLPTKQQEQESQKCKATTHRKLMKKYVQFYFWFPFFIFALIIYSCYQKQSAENSMFISVKKINEGQLMMVNECAICISEMKENDPLAALPCSSKHIFHSGCIKEWLQMKKTCPICRCDVRNARKQTK